MSNHRVMIWDGIPTSNGAPADVVLGQRSFTNGTYNDDDQDGAADGQPSARTLYDPSGVHFAGGRLVVNDLGNNRALVFQWR